MSRLFPTHLTVEQFMSRLGISRTSADTLIHGGHVRAINVSTGPGRRTWRIPVEAVEEFERTRQATPPAAPVPRRRRKAKAEPIPQYV